MARSKILQSGQSQWLRLRQLDEALETFKSLNRTTPPKGGWIREIREALGMKTSDLARRVGWAKSTVPAIERNESRGRITIESLQKAARALDCDFVYAFVPYRTLEATKQDRIKQVAAQRIRRVRRTMALESQEVSTATEGEQFADLVQRLSLEPPSDLWSEL